MTPYRHQPPVKTEPEEDPFRSIKCDDCGKPTVSMGCEMRCARCDFRKLMKVFPWGMVVQGLFAACLYVAWFTVVMHTLNGGHHVWVFLELVAWCAARGYLFRRWGF